MTTITKPIHFAIRNRRKQVVPADAAAPRPTGRVPRISKLMALAIRFDEMLRSGEVESMSELARLARVTQPRMTQIMNLLHLAPDIQEEILFLPPVKVGRDEITEREVRATARIALWSQQREKLARKL